MPDSPTTISDAARDGRSGAPSNAVDRITAGTRVVALACTLALIALGVGWELVWARTGHGSLVVKVLPLVLALPGLSRHRMYTYRWLSLAIWLYAAEGAVRIVDRAPVRALAALELLLSLVLFTACATQVRWRLAAARRAGLATGLGTVVPAPDGLGATPGRAGLEPDVHAIASAAAAASAATDADASTANAPAPAPR